MKSVQGDSGHAQVKMVADVYSHIIDEDRRLNAQRFEEQFYQSKSTPSVEEPEETTEPKETQTEQELLQKLLANPEMAALLKSLAKIIWNWGAVANGWVIIYEAMAPSATAHLRLEWLIERYFCGYAGQNRMSVYIWPALS